jgi:hypothetical protein
MSDDLPGPQAPPHEDGAELPLMISQLGMRNGQLAEPSNPAYSIAMLVWFRGPADPHTVRRAAEQTCREAQAVNVILRVGVAGAWTQTVDPSVAESIDLLDFSEHSEPEVAFRAWLDNAVATPFELLGSPLLRQTVAVVGKRVAYVAISHHTVIDGFGAALVQRRLATVYSALAEQIPVPPAQFGSLLELTRSVRTPSPDDISYWTDYLENGPPILSFTPDVAAPAPVPITRRAEISGVRKQGQIWTRLMIGAIAAYVARHTGMDEAVVGVPVSNRRNHVERRTPAMLMTVLPLRVAVDPGTSPRSVAREVGRTMAKLSSRTLQRSETLREAVPSAWRSGRLHGPIANIVPFEVESVGDNSPCVVEILNHGPVEDVSILAAPAGGADVRVELTMNPRLYSESDADEHILRIQRWLQAVADDPDQSFADLPFLTAAEDAAHRRIAEDSTDPDVSRPVGWDHPVSPSELAALDGVEASVAGAAVVDRFGLPVPFGRPGCVALLQRDGAAPIETGLLASLESGSMYFRGRRADLRFVNGQLIEMGRLAAEIGAHDGVRSALVDPTPDKARLLVDLEPGVEVDETRRQLAQMLPRGIRLRVAVSGPKLLD